MTTQEEAEVALAAAFEADSLEKHSLALESLLCDLADGARDRAAQCARKWQEPVPGRPWIDQARRLDRAAAVFQRARVRAGRK